MRQLPWPLAASASPGGETDSTLPPPAWMRQVRRRLAAGQPCLRSCTANHLHAILLADRALIS